MNQIQEINSEGFTIINNVYSETEIEKLISVIKNITENKSENSTFRKSEDLFAIRQFLLEIPETLEIILNENLKGIIKENFGNNYFLIAFYFQYFFKHIK